MLFAPAITVVARLALAAGACSAVGGTRRRRRSPALRSRRAGHPRVVRAAQEAREAVRAGVGLQPRDPRAPATPARSPTSSSSPRTTRSVTSPSASTTPSPRGRSTRACSRRTTPSCPAGAEQYPARRRRRPPAHPDRQRQRLRERRRHLVRRPRPGPAGDARRPDGPGVPRPLRAPRRCDQLARDGLPAHDDRGVRRRLARLLGAADGQRRQARRPAGRTPTRSTSPRVAATATGRSCCPTTPRRRSRSPTGRRRPARCSTPASGRWSTPACSPAPTNPEGAEALVDFLLSPDVQAALPDSMYVFPVAADAAAAAATGRRSPSSRRRRTTVDPASISEHRDDWLREWSDVTSR